MLGRIGIMLLQLCVSFLVGILIGKSINWLDLSGNIALAYAGTLILIWMVILIVINWWTEFK